MLDLLRSLFCRSIQLRSCSFPSFVTSVLFRHAGSCWRRVSQFTVTSLEACEYSGFHLFTTTCSSTSYWDAGEKNPQCLNDFSFPFAEWRGEWYQGPRAKPRLVSRCVPIFWQYQHSETLRSSRFLSVSLRSGGCVPAQWSQNAEESFLFIWLVFDLEPLHWDQGFGHRTLFPN